MPLQITAAEGKFITLRNERTVGETYPDDFLLRVTAIAVMTDVSHTRLHEVALEFAPTVEKARNLFIPVRNFDGIFRLIQEHFSCYLSINPDQNFSFKNNKGETISFSHPTIESP